jgi:hypothetical protein
MTHGGGKPRWPEDFPIEGCVAEQLLEQHFGLSGNRGKPRGEVGDTFVHSYIVSCCE